MLLPGCNRRHAVALAVSAFAGALVVACAVGSEETNVDGLSEEDASGGPSTPGVQHPATVDGGGPAHPDEPPADGGPPPVDARSDSEGGKHDSGDNPASCAVPNSCPTALNLGVVSGDTGADTQKTTGVTAKWLSVRVSENDSNFFPGRKLSLQADLISPPGVNFDLFVYVNSSNDLAECTTANGQSMNTGPTDSVAIQWGEGAIANGSDDGRTVSIEVRYVSGTCDPSTTWTLNVQGN